jgi:uncharacterized protein YcaQ
MPDINTLRDAAATHSLFTAKTVKTAVARLGFVQADPIQAPARAQDLILRQRITNYRAGDLELHYPKSSLDEDYLHVYGFMPSELTALLHPRPGQLRIDTQHPTLGEAILAFVQSNGVTSHRDLEQHFGSVRVRGYWGNQAKATTLALDSLHFRGHVRVAHRKGNERFYAAVTRAPSPQTAPERLRQLVRVYMQLYAPMSKPLLQRLIAFLGHAAPSLEGRKTIVKEMVASGELIQAEIDGCVYFWPAEMKFKAQGDDMGVRLLAPFDPVVYDRDRFEHLWGWPYRFEAYTPAAKRKWGYYALPMLWRSHVIGWANVSVKTGSLQTQLGYLDKQPRERAFKLALEEELAAMQAFLRVTA